MALSKLKKGLIITFSVIVILVILVIVFISPITKYMIEKYDEKYTGRKIEMDWAYVNPFTGSIHFDDLKIYEPNGDSIFVSFSGFGVGINVFKALSKKYEITSVSLDEPYVNVVQDRKKFNFDDLVERFTKKDTTIVVEETKDTLHLNVEDIEIEDGEFHYVQKEIPVNYFIKKVNIKSDGYYWDRDTIAAEYAFESGMGSGSIKGNVSFNLKSSDYRLATIVEKFDLKIIEEYVKDLANYGKFSAILDADIKAKGNIKEAQDVDATGLFSLTDFHFGKKPGDDYASFEKFVIDIEQLNPKQKLYKFDSLMLSKLFFRYEKYDSLDNIQRMFGKSGSNVKQAVDEKPEKFNLILEIADYIKKLAENALHSHYKLNKLGIYNADIEYVDYSLRERFFLGISPLTIISDSIEKNKKTFKVSMNTGIQPYGNINVLMKVDPKTKSDFDLTYKFERIAASLFNPYLVTYTSFPLDRGTIEINGNWVVRNDRINSTNHFVFIDPRVTKRVKKEDTKWIPMPLIMAFIRERGNVIDYEIPITGNLKDPKFHFRDIIFDVLKNIFVKPATTPYRFEIKNIEQQVEKSLNLKWAMRSKTLIPSQDRFVQRIADFLKETPEANITIEPVQFEDKEKEHIMFFESKKKYYVKSHNKKGQPLSEEDSVNIEKMSVKDPGFLAYLNASVKDSMIFTVQKKCYELLGDKIIQSKYEQLIKDRENVFLQYFKNTGTEAKVKIKKSDTGIPYNGFSFYKINYQGDIPDYLRESYEQLDQLNDENPRKRYKKERKKVFGIF